MSSQSITAWSAVVQALAAVASLVVACILVFITSRYVNVTQRILQETSKTRAAAEQSATAAQASANAAFETIHLMREQIEEAAGLGRTIVQTTIDSAVSATTYLLDHNLADWGAVRSMAPTENLFPQKAMSALDHAARIHPAGAVTLSSAFDDLKTCLAEIESLRNLAALPGAWSGEIQTPQRTKERLKTTLEKFTKAKTLLL